jgi:hypothetical protein
MLRPSTPWQVPQVSTVLWSAAFCASVDVSAAASAPQALPPKNIAVLNAMASKWFDFVMFRFRFP